MTWLLWKVLVTFALPPFNTAAITAAGLLLRRRWPRAGLALAWTGPLALLLLAVPATSMLLAHPLGLASWQAPEGDDVGAVVILGGGRRLHAPEFHGPTVATDTLERLRYGAHLARRHAVPILVTGGAPLDGGPAEGQLMADLLVDDYGLRPRWVETVSRDTRQNAALSAQLLRQAGVTRVLLVSHHWHLPKARRFFEAEGIEVVTAGIQPFGQPAARVNDWLPSWRGLEMSRGLLYAVLARVQR